MANRLKMAMIETILRLHQRGWSNRRIARELGIDRDTVSRQFRASRESANAAISLTGPSALAANKGRGSECEPWRALILAKLKQGLTAQRIHQDLVGEHGFRARLSQRAALCSPAG